MNDFAGFLRALPKAELHLLGNFLAMRDALELDEARARQLASNSFQGSFLDEAEKSRWLGQLSSP